MANELARKDGPILVLNSGSSSLKFGIYRRGATDLGVPDEDPLLTGSADGIGRDDGSLHIRSADGKSLLQRDCVHESQNDALSTLSAAIRQHTDEMPAAVGHRVVHGGPKLRKHQIITPQVLDQLRAATHFAPLHIPRHCPSSLLHNLFSLRLYNSPASTMLFTAPFLKSHRASPSRI